MLAWIVFKRKLFGAQAYWASDLSLLAILLVKIWPGEKTGFLAYGRFIFQAGVCELYFLDRKYKLILNTK